MRPRSASARRRAGARRAASARRRTRASEKRERDRGQRETTTIATFGGLRAGRIACSASREARNQCEALALRLVPVQCPYCAQRHDPAHCGSQTDGWPASSSWMPGIDADDRERVPVTGDRARGTGARRLRRAEQDHVDGVGERSVHVADVAVVDVALEPPRRCSGRCLIAADGRQRGPLRRVDDPQAGMSEEDRPEERPAELDPLLVGQIEREPVVPRRPRSRSPRGGPPIADFPSAWRHRPGTGGSSGGRSASGIRCGPVVTDAGGAATTLTREAHRRR